MKIIQCCGDYLLHLQPDCQPSEEKNGGEMNEFIYVLYDIDVMTFYSRRFN